jgi:hypothetical protein
MTMRYVESGPGATRAAAMVSGEHDEKTHESK